MGPETDNQNADGNCLKQIRDVLLCESSAIQSLANRLDSKVEASVQQLLNCQGRLIVTGMGKMGLIGRKASATFCSTGTPAIFLHPGEAVHGDLGIVTQQDVVLALSNSGETDELISLLPYFSRLGISVISLTGNPQSSLARHATLNIDISVDEEADPISLAPTTSTTVAMAMCDALAVALMHCRGFTKEQFAIFHPGGHLGRKLLTQTRDVMHQGEAIPLATTSDLLRQAMFTISQKRLGCVAVIDSKKQLQGILTDGDLRRAFERTENPLEEPVSKHMTAKPASISVDSLAAQALHLMQERKITVLPVLDGDSLVGMVHLHDLLQMGLA